MLCDKIILSSQAVFKFFYSSGKFSLCGEVFGLLLAVLVCYRSLLRAPEFSKPGKEVFCKKVTKAATKLALSFGRESFDRNQGVLSGCACMFVVGCCTSSFESRPCRDWR